MRIENGASVTAAARRRLRQEAFGDTDAFLDTFEKTAFSPDRCRCITQDGELLAALYLFDCTYGGVRAAYLYAVATAVAHRGRGLCRALMEDTHAHLAARGYAASILVPGEASLFGFYERLGYRPFGGVRSLRCDAGAYDTAVREIGTDEYARLRRLYLPDGGVLQEGENLAFLAAQATLYTGDGFVLAARREGEMLCGIELLGDAEKAPAIVRALGCKSGIFRTAGDERFAMFYPLTDGAEMPSYFGLSFD